MQQGSKALTAVSVDKAVIVCDSMHANLGVASRSRQAIEPRMLQERVQPSIVMLTRQHACVLLPAGVVPAGIGRQMGQRRCSLNMDFAHARNTMHTHTPCAQRMQVPVTSACQPFSGSTAGVPCRARAHLSSLGRIVMGLLLCSCCQWWGASCGSVTS